LIMAYREDTALTEAALQVLCMNLFLFALFRFLLFGASGLIRIWIF